MGLTFAATAVPSVILGPWAGALADRWDRRRTMIVADLIRAALVLTVPLAININIVLVYGVAFAVASVSLLFRPSKDALVPQIVDREDLVAANSATSVTETLADLIGYLAGLMVAAWPASSGRRSCSTPATYLISAAPARHAWPRTERAAGAFGIGQLWRDVKEDLVPRPPGGAAGEHRGQHRQGCDQVRGHLLAAVQRRRPRRRSSDFRRITRCSWRRSAWAASSAALHRRDRR